MRLLAMIFVISLVTGCAKTAVNECDIFSEIYPSENDTDETLRQILTHAQKGEKFCGWGQ